MNTSPEDAEQFLSDVLERKRSAELRLPDVAIEIELAKETIADAVITGGDAASCEQALARLEGEQRSLATALPAFDAKIADLRTAVRSAKIPSQLEGHSAAKAEAEAALTEALSGLAAYCLTDFLPAIDRYYAANTQVISLGMALERADAHPEHPAYLELFAAYSNEAVDLLSLFGVLRSFAAAAEKISPAAIEEDESSALWEDDKDDDEDRDPDDEVVAGVPADELPFSGGEDGPLL